MTCENAREFMSAALDGELTAVEKTELDRHLGQCAPCRALFEELSAIHGACGGLDVTPPSTLREQILNHLPPQEAPAPKKSGKVISIHWKRWSAMAAAFVLVSLAAWHLPKTLSQPPRNAVEVQPDLSLSPEPTPEPALEEPTLFNGITEDAAVPKDTPLTGAGFAADGIEDVADVANVVAGTEEADETPDAAPVEASRGKGSAISSAKKTSLSEAGAGNNASVSVAADADHAQVTAEDPAPDERTLAYGRTLESDAATPADALQSESAYFDSKDALPDTDAEPVAAAGAAAPPTLFSSSHAVLKSALAPEALEDVTAPSNAPVTAGIEDAAPTDAAAKRKVSSDDEASEINPEAGEEENAVTIHSVGRFATYCGVLTLRGDSGSLLGYTPASVQENGESWYILPCSAFARLMDELTDTGVEFDLRTTGSDISAYSEYGKVIIQP